MVNPTMLDKPTTLYIWLLNIERHLHIQSDIPFTVTTCLFKKLRK